MTLLLIYGFVSIAFSFLCSILEAVLLSVTPTFVTVNINQGKSYALKLKELKEDIDQPLITILTVNTVAHTVGAILVGVQAEKTFGSGNNAVGIVSAIMTILILVISEIIPKSIGANYWQELARFATSAIIIMMFPLKVTGILWLLQRTTSLIGKNSHNTNVSREDFHAMADLAQEEGVFHESESSLIKNMIDFKSVTAKDIMTPRTVIKMAPVTMKIKEFYDQNPNLKFSRIPLYKKTTDDISGYFLKDQLFESIIDGNGNENLESISRDIFIVQRDTSVQSLFDALIEKQEHIALVVDEFGSLSGIVSQEDIIETLLGFEIVDESDSDEDLQLLARKLWKIRASKNSLSDSNSTNEDQASS